MKIEYRDSSGRRVGSLQEAVSSHVDRAMEDRLKSVRCPEHGSMASRVEIQHSGSQVTYTARPLCCEKLREAIARSFSS